MPWMVSRYNSKCTECEEKILEGDKIYYNGKAYCESCGEEAHREDEEDKQRSRAIK